MSLPDVLTGVIFTHFFLREHIFTYLGMIVVSESVTKDLDPIYVFLVSKKILS